MDGVHRNLAVSASLPIIFVLYMAIVHAIYSEFIFGFMFGLIGGVSTVCTLILSVFSTHLSIS